MIIVTETLKLKDPNVPEWGRGFNPHTCYNELLLDVAYVIHCNIALHSSGNFTRRKKQVNIVNTRYSLERVKK